MSAALRSLPDPAGAIRLSSPEAERAVLGGVLVDGVIFGDLGLRSIDFFQHAHGCVWEALARLAARRQGIDLVSLHDELAAPELAALGGAAGIAELADLGVSSVLTAQHAVTVRHLAQRRRLLDVARSIAHRATQEPDHEEMLAAAERDVLAVVRAGGTHEPTALGSLVGQYRLELERPPEERAQIPLGVPEVGRFCAGWEPGDLGILAARPSIGKSALALQVARTVARDLHGVLFVSLEMSARTLVHRLIASETGEDLWRVRSNRGASGGNRIEWEDGLARLTDYPIWIEDSPRLTPSELATVTRRCVRKHGIKMLIVDYLQLIRIPARKGETREREVAGLSSDLKALARECEIPILALSQLSRIADRERRRPRLSDLRESGALEQDADIVMLLWRERLDSKTAELELAKQRNGPTGTVTLSWDREHQRFLGIDEGRE